MEMLNDKTILITGGTGSFGSTFVRKFINSKVKEIRIFSRDEKKQNDLRVDLASDRVKFFLGDVRDPFSLTNAVAGVDLIFHAAALKQVPSCEFYPMEAVKTNVLGSNNLIDAAVNAGVSKVVFLSTDKAVYPINAMGMTKGLMEKLAIARSRDTAHSKTVLCVTRYGNVMGSRGSVIPLFINQIKAGLDITITDPEMTRFLMSLSDSIDLVLHAFSEGQNGDIFVKKSPAATVFDLASALKAIIGGASKVKIIGTRHGEKLYESLVSREEMARAKDSVSFFRIPADLRDLNYDSFFVEGHSSISDSNDYTSHNTERLGVESIKTLLLSNDQVREMLNV